MFKSKTIVSIFTVICATLFVAAVILAWTEPTAAPPGDNVDTPINTGTTAQEKAASFAATAFIDTDNSEWYVDPAGGAGNISALFAEKVGIGTTTPGSYKLYISGGDLKVGGDIVDSAGDVIYDDATKKIERDRLPFEQGDITSDADTNTWDSGYYDVSNLVGPGAENNVKSGVDFGRGQTGTHTGAGEYAIQASAITTINNTVYNDRTIGDDVCANEFGSGWNWCTLSQWDKYAKTELPVGETFLLRDNVNCIEEVSSCKSWTQYYLWAVGRWDGVRTREMNNGCSNKVDGFSCGSYPSQPAWFIYYQAGGGTYTQCSKSNLGTAEDNIANCYDSAEKVRRYYSTNGNKRLACCPPSS